MMKKTLNRRENLEKDLNTGKKMLKKNKNLTEQNGSNVGTTDEANDSVHLKNSKAQIRIEEKNLNQYPVISKQKIDSLFSVLRTHRKPNVYEKRIDQCLMRLHNSARTPGNSPAVIMKAVRTSIIHRKWENLTRLLLMLIHLPCAKYRSIIRHMGEILDKYHPIIQEKGLHNQFKTISLAYQGVKTGNAKLIK